MRRRRASIRFVATGEEDTMSEEKKDPNPKQAFGDAKRKTQWVPPALHLGAAVAFAEGGAKYGPFNWRETQVEAMTYVGAILRHIFAYLDREDVDPESKVGKLHLEGIAACVGILLDCTYRGDLIDNRPPKGPAPRLTRSPGFVEPPTAAETEGPFALPDIESAVRYAAEQEFGPGRLQANALVDGVLCRLLGVVQK